MVTKDFSISMAIDRGAVVLQKKNRISIFKLSEIIMVLKSFDRFMMKRCKTQMPFIWLGSIMPKIYEQ
jgi:hypothetical protein